MRKMNDPDDSLLDALITDLIDELPLESRVKAANLDEDELRALWSACQSLGYPFGPIVQLLLLTGQRRDEVARMQRKQVNGSHWQIPDTRADVHTPYL